LTDRLYKDVAPFRLPGIQLDATESMEMEKVVEKRLLGRIWKELFPEESRSSHFYRGSSTLGTLLCTIGGRPLASLGPGDKGRDLGRVFCEFVTQPSSTIYVLAQTISSLPAPPGYAEAFYSSIGDGRWHRQILSESRASIRMEPL
jgi:hypothetical protein